MVIIMTVQNKLDFFMVWSYEPPMFEFDPKETPMQTRIGLGECSIRALKTVEYLTLGKQFSSNQDIDYFLKK